ncbi:MAG TPA: hypothetical protein VEB64_09355, partial [Azospirillaceae bacterium]|nr:hypothetical protein [Azospirillaceae bacterium]
VAILAVLAAGFAQIIRLEARRVGNAVGGAEARALMEEGLALAALRLQTGEEAAYWRADGMARTLTRPGGTVTVRVVDEGGKLDLNAADAGLIERLFGATALGVRPYPAVAQLAAVDEEVWRRFREYVTVHGGPQVNGATAAPDLLELLAPRDVAALLAGRADPAWQPDGPLTERLARGHMVYASTGGSVVSVRLEAVTVNGAMASAEAVVWLGSDGAAPLRRLEWRTPADSR